MKKYRFIKSYNVTYYQDVDADNFIEAKEKLSDSEYDWVQDDMDTYMVRSYVKPEDSEQIIIWKP